MTLDIDPEIAALLSSSTVDASRSGLVAFDPADDAPQYAPPNAVSGRSYMPNSFGLGEPSPNWARYDPFVVWSKQAGGDETMLEQIWDASYTTPYKRGDPAFVGVLQGGLCSAFCATTAYIYDQFRYRGQPRAAQRIPSIANIMHATIIAQCKTLTDQTLLYYKHFMQADLDAMVYNGLGQMFQAGMPSTVIVFVPKLGTLITDFQDRLSETHAVLAHGYQIRPGEDAAMDVQIWDPNFPGEKRTFPISCRGGHFQYTTETDRKCTYTSEPSQDSSVIGDMIAVPIPSTYFLVGKQPYFDGWNLFWG